MGELKNRELVWRERAKLSVIAQKKDFELKKIKKWEMG